MSEKDTIQLPGYSNPPTPPAMQTQQPSAPAAAQLQPGMGYQSQGDIFQVPGNIGNIAYLPQVYPQGAMPQQPMQPQPIGIPPGSGAYPPPGGAFPQPGVAYPNNRGYPMLPGSQTRDFTSQQPTPQQAVGAPRVYLTAMPIMALTQGAAPVDCPSCGQRALTRTEYQAGSMTHLWAIILCLCVLLPCIPYLMDSSKDVKHSCSNCGVHLATWNRSGHTIVFQHS